jgi:hypothetical protein
MSGMLRTACRSVTSGSVSVRALVTAVSAGDAGRGSRRMVRLEDQPVVVVLIRASRLRDPATAGEGPPTS